MLRSDDPFDRSGFGHFSAEHGLGDAWGNFGGVMSAETRAGMAEYEHRLQNTRDANAAQSAINRGDTNRAAAILASNPQVGMETGGQRLMGAQAASYLQSQAAQTTPSGTV